MFPLNGPLVEDVNCPLYAVGLCNTFCHYGHLKKDDENHSSEEHEEKKKELKSSSISNNANYNDEIKKEKEQIEVIDLVDDDDDDVQVLDQEKPDFDQKSPDYDQKKPDFNQKSPEFDQKGPEFDQKSPDFDQRKPDYHQKKPVFDHKNPVFNQKSPEFDQKSPDFDQRKPDYHQKKPVFDHKNPEFDHKNPDFDQKSPDLDQISDDYDIKFSSDEDQVEDDEDSEFEYSTARRHDAGQVQLKYQQLFKEYNSDKLNSNESQKSISTPNSKIDENSSSKSVVHHDHGTLENPTTNSNKRQRLGRIGHIQAFLKTPLQTNQKTTTSSSSKSKTSIRVKKLGKDKATTDAKEMSNKRKHSSSSQSPSTRKKDHDYHKDRKSFLSKTPLKSHKDKNKKSHHSYHHKEKEKKSSKSSKDGNSTDFDKLLSEIDKIQDENSSDEDNLKELLPQRKISSKISYPDRQKILQRLYGECVKTYTIARDARDRALLEEAELAERCQSLVTYQCSATNTILKIRKSEDNLVLERKTKNSSRKSVGGIHRAEYSNLVYRCISRYILSNEDLIENGYPRPNPNGIRGHVIVKSQNPAAESSVVKPDFIRVISGSTECRNLSGFVSALLEPGNYDQYVVKTHLSETSEKNEESTILQVQALLLANIRPNSIIIGHSLESQLLALKLCHNYVIDTAVLFPHTMGLPYKRSLRGLFSEILVKRISGQDSIENARAALDLVLWKIKNSPLPPLRPTLNVKTKGSSAVEDTARCISTTNSTNTPKSTHDQVEMETDLWSDLIVLPKGEEIKIKTKLISGSEGFVPTPGQNVETNAATWTCSDCTFTNYTSSNTSNYTSCFNCGWNKKWRK